MLVDGQRDDDSPRTAGSGDAHDEGTIIHNPYGSPRMVNGQLAVGWFRPAEQVDSDYVDMACRTQCHMCQMLASDDYDIMEAVRSNDLRWCPPDCDGLQGPIAGTLATPTSDDMMLVDDRRDDDSPRTGEDKEANFDDDAEEYEGAGDHEGAEDTGDASEDHQPAGGQQQEGIGDADTDVRVIQGRPVAANDCEDLQGDWLSDYQATQQHVLDAINELAAEEYCLQFGGGEDHDASNLYSSARSENYYNTQEAFKKPLETGHSVTVAEYCVSMLQIGMVRTMALALMALRPYAAATGW